MSLTINPPPAKATKTCETILYIGEDFRYWSQIETMINSLSGGRLIQFKVKKIDSYGYLPTHVLKIIKLDPKVIYIDFTKNPEFAMILAKLFRRLNSTKGIILIALFDTTSDPQMLIEAGGAGIFLSHIKGIEIHDIAYDALVLMYPKEDIKCKFAIAQTKREVDILESARIRYLAFDHLMIEANTPLMKEDQISLDIQVIEKYLPSKRYVVKDGGEINLYYDFLHWYKLNYHYIDSLPPMTAEDNPDDYKAREKKRKDDLVDVKREYEDWINGFSNKVPSLCKVLIIDKKLRLLKDFQEKSSINPIGVRYQLFLSQPEMELAYYQPHMILFGYDPELNQVNSETPQAIPLPSTTATQAKKDAKDVKDVKDEFDDSTKELGAINNPNIVDGLDLDEVSIILRKLPANNDESLEVMINAIRKIPNYNPAIIVLSSVSYHNSDYFKSRLKYPRILHDKGVISFDKLVKFEEATRKAWQIEEDKKLQEKLDKLKKINPQKYRTSKIGDVQEKYIFFKKRESKSFIYIRHTVTMISVSESEIELETTKQLRLQTVYYLPIPIKISITPITETPKKTCFVYRCLIHSAGESEKSATRQFVNDIYLYYKRHERESEMEKFNEMNQQARKKGGEGEKSDKGDKGDQGDQGGGATNPPPLAKTGT